MLGMSLLVFANDFATMSLAKDNVSHSPKPNRWEVGSITLASIIPAVCFILQGLGAIALGKYTFGMDMNGVKTVLLLNLVFSSQFRVFIVRERGHFWESRPGKELVATSVAITVLFVALGSFGVLISAVPIITIIKILAYSAVASVATDFPKAWSFRHFGIQE
jgi:H+-transporting ATPase